jgi:phospholipid-transporting ATPase
MLTGDKFETAENIAASCKLIDTSEQKEIIRLRSKQDVESFCKHETFDEKCALISSGQLKASMIVESQALIAIFCQYEETAQFIKIAKMCESVVCCRVNPSQKAEIVKQIKMDDTSLVVAAIGDGANDVPMIKEASVGIGLFGNEGMSAAQNGDFAIGEFRFIWRLFFAHGRSNYMLDTEGVYYYFYKNVLITLPQFMFAFKCGFSGQSVFDDEYMAWYNAVITTWPIAAKVLFSYDINSKTDDPQYVSQLPYLYYES